ncbi:hypothetical protein [Flavobacterium sp.]|uniref:hypothetical protein n=1 Tax=Flavobacterium sp. TaxID=239 RepID=UPI00261DA962|nr:hypothetical protein [Flavobacterium sp.]
MTRNIFVICLIAVLSLSACKEEKQTQTATEASKESGFQLSNYSDENWNAGVGREFNMFIMDNTPANAAALKDVKQVELADGTTINVTGVNVVDPFIQIVIDAKASDYQAKAAYPQYIFLKK